jgi:glycosyltransferase involved in cell wall biosynthesis
VNYKVSSIVLNDFTRDSRVQKQASSLAKAGYDLTVFALWKKGLLKAEAKEGFKIRRIRIFSSFLSGSFGRLIKFLEFSCKVSWEIKKTDIVHCHDYHPLPAMLLANLFFRSKFRVIYDAHEYESQKLGLGELSKLFIRILEKISSYFVDGFITVSGSIMEMYGNLFSKIPKTLILNCPPYEKEVESNRLQSLLSIPSGAVNCLYQGGFIPHRGIEELTQAFNNDEMKDVNIILMGHGGMTKAGQDLEKQILDLSIKQKNIYHVQSVPMHELLSFTSSASVGVCLTIDNCLNHRYSLPNKFFEYAMAGLPILVSDLPEMRKLVEDYNCGIICESITPEGIVKGLRELLRHDLKILGKNARKMAEDHSWEVQEEKLLRLYDKVLHKKTT